MSLEGDRNPIEKFFFAFALIYIFSIMGTAADLGALNPVVIKIIPALIASGVLFIVAAVGKFVEGGAVSQDGVNKAAGGSGVIPRGEAGHISSQTGHGFGVFDSELFSAKTVMVMLTAFIAPPSPQNRFCGRYEDGVACTAYTLKEISRL